MHRGHFESILQNGAAGRAPTVRPATCGIHSVSRQRMHLQGTTSCALTLISLQHEDDLDYWYLEHLRVSGIYWGLTSLLLLGHPDALPRKDLIQFVLSCMRPSGGFGAAPGHDAHMLYTVSSVQILAMLDAWEEMEQHKSGCRQIIGQCTVKISS